MTSCRLCGADIIYSYGGKDLPDICAGCTHDSDWIKAEYETMGWGNSTTYQYWKEDIIIK